MGETDVLFNSFSYFIFLPLVALIYWVIPHKFRYLLLLAANLCFYAYSSAIFVPILSFSTITAYFGGLALDKSNDTTDPILKKKKQKRILWLLLIVIVGILFFFKYTNFALLNLNEISNRLHLGWNLPIMRLLLPVGLSFFTMTIVSYLVDVYRGTIKAEPHFGYFALYVSFFPQLLAGPIAKAKKMLVQYKLPKQFNMEDAQSGLLLIILGLFKKIVIADRLAMLSDAVFEKPGQYPGVAVVIGMAFFSLQLYCDFSAYSEIALGSAKILGISIVRNFDKPLLATNTASFYRRWHISLTNWLNDYVYLPLSKKRANKGTLYMNIMIVWLVSGLWHGANWTFLFWGLLNGAFNLIGKETRAFRLRMYHAIRLGEKSVLLRIGSTLTTFFLISFSRIFFRAESIGDAFRMIRNFFIPIGSAAIKEWIPSEFGVLEFVLAVSMVILMLALEVVSEKQDLHARFLKSPFLFKWGFYFVTLFFILVFGAYGIEYSSADFLYFKF